MTATPLTEVAQRLLANVDSDRGDEAGSILEVPTVAFRDPEGFAREIDAIFHHSPLLVALSCDVPEPGDFSALTIAGRPILVVRGDDGIVRTFLNVCRHRGAQVAPECFGHARRFTCPYHSWVYDDAGTLVGNTAREAFAGMQVSGLVELPTAERVGAVFAVLTPGAALDVDEWLGDMASALSILELDKLYRHRDGLRTASGNWRATADGYVDGYHLGYLHRSSIGAKSITNRNTFDLYGPHVRVGFANKPILAARDVPVDEWHLRSVMSLVHFVFPNISISGLPGSGLMLSRILPGAGPDRCEVEQFQYFREPTISDEQIRDADEKRELYFAVTRDEDFATVLQVTDGAASVPDDVFRYGRNEPGNQNLHRWIDRLAHAGAGDR